MAVTPLDSGTVLGKLDLRTGKIIGTPPKTGPVEDDPIEIPGDSEQTQ